jgi:hypothetical protein
MRIAVTRIVSALLGFVLYGIGTPSYSEPQKVELALQCQASSVGATQLRITLRNTGSTYAQMVLGTNVGNGYRYDATAFVLDVKRHGNGTVEHFRGMSGPIAGQAGPWVVELPAMSEFSFVQPISEFVAPSSGEPLRIGGSAVDVRLHWIAPKDWLGGETASVNRRNVLAGELTTEWLRVPDQCHAA